VCGAHRATGQPTALAVLRRAIELGVNHIDTAQFYGRGVANELIHAALHPYPEDLVLVSKVGADRDADGGWIPAARPEHLRAGVEANLSTLAVEQVDVVNLRLIDVVIDSATAVRTDGHDPGRVYPLTKLPSSATNLM
jgi:aryl-alcohol dehydrogenase-like predicted oxidoreductase